MFKRCESAKTDETWVRKVGRELWSPPYISSSRSFRSQFLPDLQISAEYSRRANLHGHAYFRKNFWNFVPRVNPAGHGARFARALARPQPRLHRSLAACVLRAIVDPARCYGDGAVECPQRLEGPLVKRRNDATHVIKGRVARRSAVGFQPADEQRTVTCIAYR